jgi:hypothetical protein
VLLGNDKPALSRKQVTSGCAGTETSQRVDSNPAKPTIGFFITTSANIHSVIKGIGRSFVFCIPEA